MNLKRLCTGISIQQKHRLDWFKVERHNSQSAALLHSSDLIKQSTFTHLEVPHVQENQVIPEHQVDPEHQGVLALPLPQWVLQGHRGHQEGLEDKHDTGK